MSKDTTFMPPTDGKDHINVHAKGITKLGRMLSTWSSYPVDHPELGHFANMAAYLLYVQMGEKHDEYRELTPRIVRDKAQKLSRKFVCNGDDEHFVKRVQEGCFFKVHNNDEIFAELMKKPYLPLMSYGVHKNEAGELVKYEMRPETYTTEHYEKYRAGLVLGEWLGRVVRVRYWYKDDFDKDWIACNVRDYHFFKGQAMYQVKHDII
jgi:hypothetical protein